MNFHSIGRKLLVMVRRLVLVSAHDLGLNEKVSLLGPHFAVLEEVTVGGGGEPVGEEHEVEVLVGRR